MRDAELNWYWEAEPSKWEAREEQAVQQLEPVRPELDKISTDKHGVGDEIYG